MARALVIEDDPTQRLLCSSVLKSAGHEVTEAANGSEGLRTALTLKPDIIVCDVMMPGLNGYQMVAELKRHAETASIPVIFLSAMKEHAHIRIGMTTGADDYLPKPFSAKELQQSVAVLLDKRKRQEDRFAAEAGEIVEAALQDQRQALSGKYEKQLLKELNRRWQDDMQSDDGLQYADVPVVSVDLFGLLMERLPGEAQRAAAIKRIYAAASDALYLFGARHLVPFGHHLAAVFASEVRGDPGWLRFQAVRAAFTMQKSLRSTVESIIGHPLPDADARALCTISLHTGPLTLIGIGDPLHGGDGVTLLTGEAVSGLIAISRHARAAHWQVGCSAAFAEGIEHEIVTGPKVPIAAGANYAGLDAMELLAIAPAKA